MDFTLNKYMAPRAIEKIKILGAVLELPDKQHYIPRNPAKWAELAVLFSW